MINWEHIIVQCVVSLFDNFQLFTDEGQVNRVSSIKYLGVVLAEKWK